MQGVEYNNKREKTGCDEKYFENIVDEYWGLAGFGT